MYVNIWIIVEIRDIPEQGHHVCQILGESEEDSVRWFDQQYSPYMFLSLPGNEIVDLLREKRAPTTIEPDAESEMFLASEFSDWVL